ncbi:EamA family transporter [Paeniglutamicibacter antarcticus]|uniref:EamA family transporter n=1 Tax=Arthrobacter terrae TaxID=2935737 RepID=A0A931G5G1_9MICC|nr:EamA family transporter [Arthrobacter terrae]MBG0740816.1 EamA family transporter [Arthrobacter terrae]
MAVSSNRHHSSVPLAAALLSAAAFALSGSFAKALFESGWSPGAAVAVRIGGAAAVLLIPVIATLIRRWSLVRGSLARVALYGIVPIALCQLFYFNAVSHLSVGVALLLEYLSPVLLVGWVWLRTKAAPGLLTVLGGLCAMGGLVLVLDLTGSQKLDAEGILWGLAAAVCSATFFIMSARAGDDVPPVLMAGGGMAVGAVLIFGLGGLGVMPLTFSTENAVFASHPVSWLVPIFGLVLVTTVLSYLAGIIAVRGLGTKVSSFLALFEVLFAVIWAWLLLGELPRTIQLLGGALIVGGVILVRVDELRGPGHPELDHANDLEPLPLAK